MSDAESLIIWSPQFWPLCVLLARLGHSTSHLEGSRFDSIRALFGTRVAALDMAALDWNSSSPHGISSVHVCAYGPGPPRAYAE